MPRKTTSADLPPYRLHKARNAACVDLFDAEPGQRRRVYLVKHGTPENLRASRESELMRTHDLSTVCRWIGNSSEVAAKHYAMSMDRDADFEKATALANDPDGKLREALEKAQHSSSATPGNGRTPSAA